MQPVEQMDVLEAARKLMDIADVRITRQGITPEDVVLSSTILQRLLTKARSECRKRGGLYSHRYAQRLARHIERKMNSQMA